jgi:hypothetical protein
VTSVGPTVSGKLNSSRGRFEVFKVFARVDHSHGDNKRGTPRKPAGGSKSAGRAQADGAKQGFRRELVLN